MTPDPTDAQVEAACEAYDHVMARAPRDSLQDARKAMRAEIVEATHD